MACFRPNQLLTGAMQSARGVHRLNAASHKVVLFQRRLSARCPQPHIAHDRLTGVNGGSCRASSEAHRHSVTFRSSLHLTTHALISVFSCRLFLARPLARLPGEGRHRERVVNAESFEDDRGGGSRDHGGEINSVQHSWIRWLIHVPRQLWRNIPTKSCDKDFYCGYIVLLKSVLITIFGWKPTLSEQIHPLCPN